MRSPPNLCAESIIYVQDRIFSNLCAKPVIIAKKLLYMGANISVDASGGKGVLGRNYIVLCSLVALVIGVGIVTGIALCSGSSGYEAENRVGDWILSVRVTSAPQDNTVDNMVPIIIGFRGLGH